MPSYLSKQREVCKSNAPEWFFQTAGYFRLDSQYCMQIGLNPRLPKFYYSLSDTYTAMYQCRKNKLVGSQGRRYSKMPF